MPSPLNQLPAGPTALAERVKALERQVRELQASRRASNATIGGGDTTITGARIQTASDGRRVVLDSDDGSIQVYDDSDDLTNYMGGPNNYFFNQDGWPDGEFVGFFAGNFIMGVGNGLSDIDLGVVGLIGVLGSGDAYFAQSPSTATNPTALHITYRSGNTGATPGSAAAPHAEHQGDLWMGGAAVAAAYPPAGGAFAPTTWQTPTWGSGWSSTGTLNGMTTFRGLQCRYTVEDEVWVLGAAVTTGTNSSLCTLPAGYWPKTNQRVLLPAYFFQSGTGVKPGFVQVTEAGVINMTASLSGVTVAAGTQVWINGKFPLGNLT